MAINAQELQGQWNQLKGQVKEKWGQLTDDDLNVSGGNFDQVIGKIQQRTGEGREAIEKFLGNLTSGGASTISQAADKVREKWGQLSDDDLTIQGGNVDQLIGRIQQKTGEGREAIEKFLGTLTSGGASGVSGVAEAARGYAQNLTSNLGDYASGAGDRLRQGYGQASDFARDQYGNAEDLVRHNPGQSVAVAFGIGIVVGVVVGLSLRSR